MTSIDPGYAANTLANIVGALKGTVDDQTKQMTAVGAPPETARPNQLAGNPNLAPGTYGNGTYDNYAVSQEYGVNGHPGIDIGVPVGTRLVSPISGTVTHAADDDPGGYGSWVEITGADGTVIRYGHLSSIGVNVGTHVDAGTPIGASGGNAGAQGAGNSTGAHLHFEVHQGAGAVSPDAFLAGGWQILG